MKVMLTYRNYRNKKAVQSNANRLLSDSLHFLVNQFEHVQKEQGLGRETEARPAVQEGLELGYCKGGCHKESLCEGLP